MFKSLLNRVFWRFKPKPKLPQGLRFAFMCGGKRYYTFLSEMDLPVERALAAKDVYAELEQGLSRKYLETLFETCEQLLDKGKIVQTSQLLGIAKNKIRYISNALLLYKLASVMYVEENEDVYRYDFVLEEKKIENWLKNKDVESFFLQEPLKRYLPHFESLGVSIKTYFKAQGEELVRAYKYHLSLLDDKPENETLRNSIKQQLALASQLAQLAE